MQAMQRLAPEMKELQAKYKDDKQRQQQEMMKFYKENKVNPFAVVPAAGAAVAGLHLAVLHAAQDLKQDICAGDERAAQLARAAQRRSRTSAATPVDPEREVPLHPGHHGQGDRARPGRADRRSTSARSWSRAC